MSIWHMVYDEARLHRAYCLTKEASAGMDGETKEHYGENLVENLADLSARLKRGAYHARPVRRVYIPKPDGRQRPLGIPTLEDKLVQRATCEVLEAIYEVDFHEFSFGFRPGRNQHQALDTLALAIERRPMNWVLDADIRGFFDNIDHEWLMRFVEVRIKDKRVLRHIRKWLLAGVLEDGVVHAADYGTPQGGSISPLLANIYLHYAFDNWAILWQRRKARGHMQIVRYADDIVVCFQHREDAERFLAEMQERLGRFHLELNMEKTRLIEFGRRARQNRRDRGDRPPETFDFLGLTHCCGTLKKGRFAVVRRTARKKLRAKLAEIGKELRKRMHDPIPLVGKWLSQVLKGHYQYYGVPLNLTRLHTFRYQITRRWKSALARRSDKAKDNWERMSYLAKRYLPMPRLCHSYPSPRPGVIYPR
ncbi:MAG: group II intron reverse transcriptase/maturase [Capsulimonadaceae bacterium]|nr:group II intron reverse transcriptase/maturase [Capsulimonadaceae bacterium]